MRTQRPNVIATSDDPYRPQFPVTEWFGPDVLPTLAGPYECKTGGGHVFKRRFDGKHWRNQLTDEVSAVELPWRGVVPLSYPPTDPAVVADQELQVAKQHCDAIQTAHLGGMEMETTGLPNDVPFPDTEPV